MEPYERIIDHKLITDWWGKPHPTAIAIEFARQDLFPHGGARLTVRSGR